MPPTEKTPTPVQTNFDIIFAKLSDPENVEIVRINAEIAKETETIRLLREAAGDQDSAPFVMYSA